MSTYLVISNNNTLKSYQCKTTHIGTPYLKVGNGYLDLTTNLTYTTQVTTLDTNSSGQTSSGTTNFTFSNNLNIKHGTSTYRPTYEYVVLTTSSSNSSMITGYSGVMSNEETYNCTWYSKSNNEINNSYSATGQNMSITKTSTYSKFIDDTDLNKTIMTQMKRITTSTHFSTSYYYISSSSADFSYHMWASSNVSTIALEYLSRSSASGTTTSAGAQQETQYAVVYHTDGSQITIPYSITDAFITQTMTASRTYPRAKTSVTLSIPPFEKYRFYVTASKGTDFYRNNIGDQISFSRKYIHTILSNIYSYWRITQSEYYTTAVTSDSGIWTDFTTTHTSQHTYYTSNTTLLPEMSSTTALITEIITSVNTTATTNL